MSKIRLDELNRFLKQCGIGLNSDEIGRTPCVEIHHIHEWDHGYDGPYGISVNVDGSIRDTGFSGTRREFYTDMREMTSFLCAYFRARNVKKLIAAPCFRYNQFSFGAEENDIYDEIYSFLRENGVRKNERSGITISVAESFRQVEMIVEGGFRGISELCLFAPEQKVLLAPNHHFGVDFFAAEIGKEKIVLLDLLAEYPTLQCYGKDEI